MLKETKQVLRAAVIAGGRQGYGLSQEKEVLLLTDDVSWWRKKVEFQLFMLPWFAQRSHSHLLSGMAGWRV